MSSHTYTSPENSPDYAGYSSIHLGKINWFYINKDKNIFEYPMFDDDDNEEDCDNDKYDKLITVEYLNQSDKINLTVSVPIYKKDARLDFYDVKFYIMTHEQIKKNDDLDRDCSEVYAYLPCDQDHILGYTFKKNNNADKLLLGIHLEQKPNNGTGHYVENHDSANNFWKSRFRKTKSNFAECLVK
jgi:hypothetical protein